jgi:ankyrin repeat protein
MSADTDSEIAKILSNPRYWLQQLIWRGDRDLVMEMLQNSPELLHARLSGNATPLLAAAYAQKTELAESFLAMGAKLDYITAIALNRRDTVEAMLNHDPELIHKQSPDRIGCLHVAVRFADYHLVSLLLARGANANDNRNPKKLTPIFMAWADPSNNANLLLQAGANVNAQSKHGFTPLHWAARSGRSEYVRWLLANGANAPAQTSGRQTAWTFAVRYKHHEIASILTSHEAKA